MDIEGPLKIGVLDKGDGTGWELHLDFREDFRGLNPGGSTENPRRIIRSVDGARE